MLKTPKLDKILSRCWGFYFVKSDGSFLSKFHQIFAKNPTKSAQTIAFLCKVCYNKESEESKIAFRAYCHLVAFPRTATFTYLEKEEIMIRIINDLSVEDLTDFRPWAEIQDELSSYRAIWAEMYQHSIGVELAPSCKTNFLLSDFNPLQAKTDAIISTHPCRLVRQKNRLLLVPTSKKYDENILFLTVSTAHKISSNNHWTPHAEIILQESTQKAANRWINFIVARMGKRGFINLEIEQPEGLPARYNWYSFAQGSEREYVREQERLECAYFADGQFTTGQSYDVYISSRNVHLMQNLVKNHPRALKAEKQSMANRERFLPRLKSLNCIIEQTLALYQKGHVPLQLVPAFIVIDPVYAESKELFAGKLAQRTMCYTEQNVLFLERLMLQAAGIDDCDECPNASLELIAKLYAADVVSNRRIAQVVAHISAYYHPLCGYGLAASCDDDFRLTEVSNARRIIMKWEFQRLLKGYRFACDSTVTDYQTYGLYVEFGGCNYGSYYYDPAHYKTLKEERDFLEQEYLKFKKEQAETTAVSEEAAR